MKLAVMQPYLFPYIGYWQLINAVDYFVIYDDVNFIKKSFINRNSVLVNNESKLITLELFGASQNKQINEIEVGNNFEKVLKTIELNYKRAPYFESAFPVFNKVLRNKEKNLAKYIGFSLINISEYLGIKTKFLYSSNIKKNNDLTAHEKILEIAKILKASHYINPIGGKNIYDKDIFAKKNIDLSFLSPSYIEYKQFNDKFEPNLSIIDIMMFNNKKEIASSFLRYELI
jgi:hypothetical protein